MKPSIKRVLLPLSAQRPPLGMFEHAADMAARLQSELCGLFIEDSDLLNFSQLPIGREFCLSTGRIQSSSINTMERSLRQIASKSQQELLRLASHYKINSQFVTRRGHHQQTIQAEYQIGDLLVLSSMGTQVSRALAQQAYDYLHSGHHYLAWLPAKTSPVDGITVVQDNSPAAEQAIELAEQLVKDNGHTISVETYTDINTLKDKLQNSKQSLWIVPYRKEWNFKLMEQLLEYSRCPVLLVNT